MAHFDFIPDGMKEIQKDGKAVLVPLDAKNNDDLQKLYDQAKAQRDAFERRAIEAEERHTEFLKKALPPAQSLKIKEMEDTIAAQAKTIKTLEAKIIEQKEAIEVIGREAKRKTRAKTEEKEA